MSKVHYSNSKFSCKTFNTLDNHYRLLLELTMIGYHFQFCVASMHSDSTTGSDRWTITSGWWLQLAVIGYISTFNPQLDSDRWTSHYKVMS